jgi:hypothetical protein
MRSDKGQAGLGTLPRPSSEVRLREGFTRYIVHYATSNPFELYTAVVDLDIKRKLLLQIKLGNLESSDKLHHYRIEEMQTSTFDQVCAELKGIE